MSVRFLTEFMHDQLREIIKHKGYLSKRDGRDVGLDAAAVDFITRGFAQTFQEEYFRKHNITATETEMNGALNGDSCLIVEFKAVAHNHETGIEAVLEDKIIRYCLGKRANCPYQREVGKGIYFCRREEMGNS